MSEGEYEFSEQWHKDSFPNHSGEQGHYCLEWDDLYICKDCMEFEFCNCFDEDNIQHQK